MKQLKQYGCQLAIDDFGSGFANFEYLLRFNPDVIKIDGSLIKNIQQDKDARLIVKTVVNFAKEAGIKTVAEFVDSQAADTIVTELGVDFGQGYFYSQPQDLFGTVPSKA